MKILIALLISLSSFAQTQSVYGVEVKRVYTTFTIEDTETNIPAKNYAGMEAKFVFFDYDSNGRPEVGFVIENGDVISINETQFKIDVSLFDRKVVFQDTLNPGLVFAFPIAPGGLNVFEQRSVTPEFKNAYVLKATAIEKRCKPSYFHCLPFIRVMTDESVSKGWTGIGFHIKQNPQLKRTFDSHGCIRLSEEDLFAFDRILRYGRHRSLKLDFHKMHRPDIDITAVPLVRNFYQKEKDFGGGETRRGKSGLVIFSKISSAPPWEKLAGVGASQRLLNFIKRIK